MRNIIKKFNLTKTYNVETLEDAIERLDKLTKIEKISEHIISIQVKDRSKERAAQIANEYVNELRQINKNIYNTTFVQNSELVKRRLMESKQKIFKLIKSLQLLNEENSSYMKTKSIKDNLDKAIELCVEMSLLDPKYNNNNSTQHKISELEQKFIYVVTILQSIKKDNFSSEKIERLIIELINDLKVEMIIYHQLNLQLQELMNLQQTSSKFIYILDEAVPAEKPTQRITIIILIALLLNILINFLIISVSEYIRNIKNQYPEEFKRLYTIT